MSRLALFLLGPPRVEREGQPIKLDRHKALALLAFLAVTGQRHGREYLAALLWPELDGLRARSNLRRALSSLTGALPGEWWDIDREQIGFEADTAWLDVRQFEILLGAGRQHGHATKQACRECVSPLVEAARLYRGDFLAGFSLRDSPGFDEWQVFQAESLRSDLAGALSRLADANAAEGDFHTAIRHARRWLALDSLHEPAHRQLMWLYYEAGQREAALRQFGECVRLLEQELGVSPQPATAELYAAIKANAAVALSAALAHAPVAAAPAAATRTRDTAHKLTPLGGS